MFLTVIISSVFAARCVSSSCCPSSKSLWSVCASEEIRRGSRLPWWTTRPPPRLTANRCSPSWITPACTRYETQTLIRHQSWSQWRRVESFTSMICWSFHICVQIIILLLQHVTHTNRREFVLWMKTLWFQDGFSLKRKPQVVLMRDKWVSLQFTDKIQEPFLGVKRDNALKKKTHNQNCRVKYQTPSLWYLSVDTHVYSKRGHLI